MEQPQDAGLERNLVAEANTIARQQDSNRNPPSKAANISFTSLSQAKIPNFSLMKRLGQFLKVEFIPDFYYPLQLAQTMFLLAKQDGALKRVEEVNIHSLTLYLAYAMFYYYLSVIYEANPNQNLDLLPILTIFQSNGFRTFSLPTILTEWISGLGKFISTDTRKIFLPKIPNIVNNGIYYDNYYFSQETAHLFPNFRLLNVLSNLFSDIRPYNMANNLRNKNYNLGNDHAGIAQVHDIELARRYAFRSPGAREMCHQVNAPDLTSVITAAIARVQLDPLRRFLVLDAYLLQHLAASQTTLFHNIETFDITSINIIGTSLTLLPIVHKEQTDIIDAVNTPLAANVPQCIIQSLPDYNSIVQSRTEVVNGYADYVPLTPLIRIANEATTITLDPAVPFVDPQPPWYSNEIEFMTPEFTIADGHSYFTRN